MKVLSIPKDGNPYQENLYREMRTQGVEVEYLGQGTKSATLNWLLLPLELVARRRRGWSIVHVHWLYPFASPLSERVPLLRRISAGWLHLWLAIAGRLGMTVVWTAHNVLPHAPIFRDDIAARRRLLTAADLVIAHSDEALTEVESVLGRPAAAAVIPHGTFVNPADTEGLRPPGATPGEREILFFGRMLEYKGLDELAEAAAGINPDIPLRIRIVGPCGDDALADRLTQQAARPGSRLIVEIGFVDDADLVGLFARADAVVLPFRRITTSSSAEISLNYGRPLVMPDLATLASFPDEALLRYPPGVDGLRSALEEIAVAEPATLGAMSKAALVYSRGRAWHTIASHTREALADHLPRAIATTADPAAKGRS